MKSEHRLTELSCSRHGTGVLDLLVSFTLLVTVMTVSSPLIVRHGRLMKSQRDYRLALDELSNQMDRLTAVPAGELSGAMQQLSPSAFIAERLPGAELKGDLEAAEFGTRVTLKLSWNEVQRDRAPLSLAAWVFTNTPQSGDAPAEVRLQ